MGSLAGEEAAAAAECEPLLLLPPEPPAPVFEARGESFDDSLDSVSWMSSFFLSSSVFSMENDDCPIG